MGGSQEKEGSRVQEKNSYVEEKKLQGGFGAQGRVVLAS
jgi:hypothetical protein